MFGIFILHHYVSVGTVIAAKSFTKGWIQAQRSANKGADPGLIERHSNHQTEVCSQIRPSNAPVVATRAFFCVYCPR